MQKLSLEAVAREQAQRAGSGTSGRSSTTVYGGHEHVLRQTVIALAGGSALDEHVNPGEATVYVLGGRIRVRAGEDSWDGRTGDMIVMPEVRHSVEAIEDSVVLLTVAKSPDRR